MAAGERKRREAQCIADYGSERHRRRGALQVTRVIERLLIIVFIGFTAAFAYVMLVAQKGEPLKLTDTLIGDPHRPPPDLHESLREHFDEGQIVEAAMGVGLFLGMSKVLICLGLEPEEMATTILPTPGSAANQANS